MEDLAFKKNIDLNLNSAQVAEEWADIVIDRFQQALDKYDIGTLMGGLFNSFKKELVKESGDVDAVIFKFLKYGRFVDMGVGRGQSINGLTINKKFETYKDYRGKTVGRSKRQPKRWYSKTFYREVAILANIYSETIGNNTVRAIENGLTGEINLNL